MPATAGDTRLAANKFNVLSGPAMILLITYTERNETGINDCISATLHTRTRSHTHETRT